MMQTPSPPNKKMMARCAWLKDSPTELINRSKTGFSIPVRQWLQSETDISGRGLRPWAKIVYNEMTKSVLAI